jgi:hypothetical protein
MWNDAKYGTKDRIRESVIMYVNEKSKEGINEDKKAPVASTASPEYNPVSSAKFATKVWNPLG